MQLDGVREAEFPGFGRGLRAERAFASGEIIVGVRVSDCIHGEPGRDSLCTRLLVPSFRTLFDRLDPELSRIDDRLALRLLSMASQSLLATDPDAAQGQPLRPESAVRRIPTSFDQPINWNEAELALLRGHDAQLATLLRAETASDHVAFVAAVSLSAMTVLEPEAASLLIAELTLDRYRWALSASM